MKHVWVKYRNGAEDIVNQRTLNNLLAQDSIEKFYRASESRWITLRVDKIRGTGGRYGGPEKRNIESQESA